MAESIGFASCVRGYHVYQEIWTLSEGETLICSSETYNREDPFAVALKYGIPSATKKVIDYRLPNTRSLSSQLAIFEFTVSNLPVHG